MVGGHLGVNIDGLGSESDFLLIIAELANCLSFKIKEVTCLALIRSKVKPFVTSF